MPTLTGAPNRAFNPSGRIVHEPGASLGNPPSVKIPADRQDIIGATQTVTIRTAVNMRVVKIQADIPAGCTSSLKLDNKEIHNTQDGDGSVGTIELGDMAANMGLQVRDVEVTITNNNTESKNARYYLVGLP